MHRMGVEMKDKDSLVYLAAFRYALGRSSYITSVIADELLTANLLDQDKKLIIKEINEAEGKLGMDMDEKVWLEVRDTFEAEIKGDIYDTG